MSVIATNICGFCGEPVLRTGIVNRDSIDVECRCCGTYRISGTADDVLVRRQLSERQKATLAYAVRRRAERAPRDTITSDWLDDVLRAGDIPRPQELLDFFVLWMGAHSAHVGAAFDVTCPEFKAILGVENGAAFNYVTDAMAESPWFSGIHRKTLAQGENSMLNCALTSSGWRRLAELESGSARSTIAFMAMKFGNAELRKVVQEHFVPQVALAGYRLKTLDEEQPAGLIDDQLRVAIRTARLLICDLSDGNAGAYWEAGFAEGLGRPVIYTCRLDVFENRQHQNHPHFDTNHMVTVPWDPADPAVAAQKLKATIRATLPSEARLVD